MFTQMIGMSAGVDLLFFFFLIIWLLLPES
jgi:hypothetical protein